MTADRKSGPSMTCRGKGRLTNADIAESLEIPPDKDVILCSDGHASHKGYANDNQWIASTFWGVSTKYLQNYLNWYLKKEASHANALLRLSMMENKDLFATR